MTNSEPGYRDLKIDDIRKLIDEGYEIVDVREPWEYERGHVPGARNVVLASIIGNPGRKFANDRTILVCEVGERSAVASEMAVAQGTQDVVNFRGGTKAWRDAGLTLEK